MENKWLIVVLIIAGIVLVLVFLGNFFFPTKSFHTRLIDTIPFFVMVIMGIIFHFKVVNGEWKDEVEGTNEN